MTKGIILSGGTGTRLFPLTTVVNKQLLHVYDKPMIYYALSTLIRKGIKDICIISSPAFIQHYLKLLINSASLGLSIEFRAQDSPRGIPEALTIADSFIGKDGCCLMLGDNIFHGAQRYTIPEEGAMIFGYPVNDPSIYGVVDFDSKGNVTSIEEKPENPKSKYAIPGVYFFDNKCVKYAHELKPSERGELEITDLIQKYLDNKALKVTKLNRGFVWLDAGLPSTLHQASCYIQTMQERQGISIGCIEEACYRSGFINKKQLRKVVESYPDSEYKLYLERVLSE